MAFNVGPVGGGMHLVLLKYHEISLRLIQHHWKSLDDADMCHGQLVANCPWCGDGNQSIA